MKLFRIPDARRARRLACGAFLLVTACGGGEATAPAAETPKLIIASVVVEEPATGMIFFSHDDHWHGFPVLRAGESREQRVYFVARGRAPDDHDMPPRNEWFTLADRVDHDVPAVIEDPAIARWTGGRTGGTLQGDRTGASRINFRVKRGPTTLWEAPPLNFTVRP